MSLRVLLIAPQIYPHSIHAGPAAYSLPTPCPPAPLIGEKLSACWEPDYPAPNEYDVPDNIGKVTAKTIGTKPHPSDKCLSPDLSSEYNSTVFRLSCSDQLQAHNCIILVHSTCLTRDVYIYPPSFRSSCPQHIHCQPAQYSHPIQFHLSRIPVTRYTCHSVVP